jgi:hypothetical protein
MQLYVAYYKNINIISINFLEQGLKVYFHFDRENLLAHSLMNVLVSMTPGLLTSAAKAKDSCWAYIL